MSPGSLEGYSQGLQDGLLQGRQQGKKSQREAALRIAPTMLAQGSERGWVLRVTDLNEDDRVTAPSHSCPLTQDSIASGRFLNLSD
ncbi:Rpn family recombination-promoting nuclease/putative transposase [Citrobacter sedlakii]|uniref:Rpn family recombination-promoting nuclease/putative transposase n=1 Tax=Citrobacter TaxID=544 RepID=UPI001969B1E3|nr:MULTISPECIES: Rpn family recombination-promoting nuclease/putative transposase [Citrobacter]MBM9565976.1 Rpn family recombination-promoting nuclease/putative transposase [Citrobacter sedlakii]HBL4691103.1 Rpn family recombination-promoting nuclease/putative transposase [Citrobacter sedlakii]HBL4706013.1 Rpn family recombination-promoting nuclease/putative transposase [Citrobacter sedlakii]HBL4720291.1 Rpn family recombination-promoting nuclease/putative transposase [Citrobacter sedlakii]HCA